MAIKLRASVRRFAEQMELQLQANEHKGGWDSEHVYMLIQQIGNEHRQLIDAVLTDPSDIYKVIKEAADTANYAMMVADLVHRYGVQNVLPSTPNDIEKWRAFLLSTNQARPCAEKEALQ